MALDELAATIEKIKSRIANHREAIAKKETRTRQVLIDPLLIALGWDVADPTQVELEFEAGQGRADYALMGDDGPVAMVEAKRLNESLENHIMQVLNYANLLGINYIVITNGDEWKMYSVFEQGPIEQRMVMNLDIAEQPAHVNALKSLSLWRVNLNSSIDLVPASDPVLSGPENVATPKGLLEIDVPTSQGVDAVQPVWHSIDQLGDLSGVRGPAAVKNESGSLNQSLRGTWVDMYRTTVSWLITSGFLTKSMCPIGRPKSKIRIIANTSPVRLDGSPLIYGSFEVGGIHFDKDYTANDFVANLMTLFDSCGVAAKSVSIRYD